jgi:hypothetical protein
MIEDRPPKMSAEEPPVSDDLIEQLRAILGPEISAFLAEGARVHQQPDEIAALRILLSAILLGMGNHYRRFAQQKALGDLWVQAYLSATSKNQPSPAQQPPDGPQGGSAGAPYEGVYRNGTGWRAKVVDPLTKRPRFLATARTVQEASRMRADWLRQHGLPVTPWDKHLADCKRYAEMDPLNAPMLREHGDAFILHLAYDIAREEGIEGTPDEKPPEAVEVERIVRETEQKAVEVLSAKRAKIAAH